MKLPRASRKANEEIMQGKPRTILIAQGLFYLNAAIWLFFEIYSSLRLGNSINVPAITLWIISILMFGNALAMFFTGIWLGHPSRWAFFLGMVILMGNILLTFTDQVGFFDIATALLDFVLLGLLLYNRKYFFN